MNQIRLKSFFETFDPEVNLNDFKSMYAGDVHFNDPLCELNDVAAVYRFFQQIYQKVDEPKFFVSESISKEDTTYVQWKFYFSFQDKQEEHIVEGISRIIFDSQGKIIEQTNYWDTAEHIYEIIPLLGNLLRWIKKGMIS